MKVLIPTLVKTLKWPIAAMAAALTPAGALCFWRLSCDAWHQKLWETPFGIGFGVMLAAWIFVRRIGFVRFWSTMEHELTHALFAWATFVPVRELRTTDGSLQTEDNSEGHILSDGAHWLMAVSPYFFPTASAFLLVATWLLAAQPTELARFLLGAATAYSISSTWSETGLHQTDLQRVGFGFACVFLPGANLLSYGSLLANELGGPSAALHYWTEAFRITLSWVQSAIA
jgi:hypothetical protein